MNVSTSAVETAPAPTRNFRWRVVDIVVASVIGVASGLVFLLWNIAYRGPSALLEPLLPGLQGLLDGPWLFAGVLGALIIQSLVSGMQLLKFDNPSQDVAVGVVLVLAVGLDQVLRKRSS